MGIFIVSFLVFAAVAGLLVLCQTLGRRSLPVGCRPESGDCCAFGNSKGPGVSRNGRVKAWCPDSGHEGG